MSYDLIIPARNEEKYLDRTLHSLITQTLRPERIIVVDDGSTDKTGEIAHRYTSYVVHLLHHNHSLRTTPRLSSVLNSGLQCIREDADYIMILGADHILKSKYAEKLVYAMQDDPKLAITGGFIDNEPNKNPRGSGRMIRKSFWDKKGCQYPLNYGYESWLIFYAKYMGYKVQVIKEAHSVLQRKSGKPKNRPLTFRALGYWWPYVLVRCLKDRSIKNFVRWLFSDAEQYEFADWTKRQQKKRFKNMLKNILLS